MENRRHIVMICDDAYVMPTMVCIRSIAESVDKKKKAEYAVHVCTAGISERNRERLEKLSEDGFTVSADVVKNDVFRDRREAVIQKTHVSTAALLKFELANIYRNIDRVLYLDSDILVKKDLSELFELDLGDCYGAAAGAFNYYFSGNKEPGKEFFFNSGVMLLDLKKMREKRISDALWNYKLNKASTYLMDQESFNAVLDGRMVPIPVNWNFGPNYLNKNYCLEIFRTVDRLPYSSMEEIAANVSIIHYLDRFNKPWKFYGQPMQKDWLEVYHTIDDIEKLPWRKNSTIGKIRMIYGRDGIRGLLRVIKVKAN